MSGTTCFRFFIIWSSHFIFCAIGIFSTGVSHCTKYIGEQTCHHARPSQKSHLFLILSTLVFGISFLSPHYFIFHYPIFYFHIPMSNIYYLIWILYFKFLQSIPVVYILMESKSRKSYECVLQFVKTNLLSSLTLKILITDYEAVLRDVLISEFSEARYARYWFHHNQVKIHYKINS